MRKAVTLVIALLVGGVVLGSTVFRQQVADAASSVLNVFVTNDSSHPVPVTAPAIDRGATILGPIIASSSAQAIGVTVTATALVITMTPGVQQLQLVLSSVPPFNPVANFVGPAVGGQSNIVLALPRPIKFDTVLCQGPSTDTCTISDVGAQP